MSSFFLFVRQVNRIGWLSVHKFHKNMNFTPFQYIYYTNCTTINQQLLSPSILFNCASNLIPFETKGSIRLR
jgi:hypothetical protein